MSPTYLPIYLSTYIYIYIYSLNMYMYTCVRVYIQYRSHLTHSCLLAANRITFNYFFSRNTYILYYCCSLMAPFLFLTHAQILSHTHTHTRTRIRASFSLSLSFLLSLSHSLLFLSPLNMPSLFLSLGFRRWYILCDFENPRAVKNSKKLRVTVLL